MSTNGQILVGMMQEDGIRFPSGGGDRAERLVNCISNSHDDRTASMSVNSVEGVFFCFGCGLGGNSFTYARDFRGINDIQAIWKYLEDRGMTPSGQLSTKRQNKAPSQAQAKQKLKWMTQIPPINGKDTTHHYEYKTPGGKTVMVITRGVKKDGKKAFFKYSPSITKGEGWWSAGCTSDRLPVEDRLVAKSPLYNAPLIQSASMDDQIFIVEGEKAAEALMHVGIEGKPDWKKPVATTIHGGTAQKAHLKDHDFDMLKGRKIVLIPDEDEGGIEFMVAIGHHLVNTIGVAECKMFTPKLERDKGFDIADLAHEKPNEMLSWNTVKEYLMTMTPRIVKKQALSLAPPPMKNPDDSDEIEVDEEKIAGLADNQYFKMLGWSSVGKCVFLIKATNQIREINAEKMTNPTVLVMLADLSFWTGVVSTKEKVEEISRKVAMYISNNLFRLFDSMPIFDPNEDSFGRGSAVLKDGRYAYHLGDSLLVQSTKDSKELDRKVALSDETSIFTPRPRISIASSTDKGPEYAKDLCDAILGYRWKSQEDGKVFLGWLVTSLLGGVLTFRPQLWLRGRSGTGKGYVLKEMIHKVMGNAVIKMINATEAGIATQLLNDSLPAFVDEFEPGVDVMKFRAILDSVRSASGGEGNRVRAGDGPIANVMLRYSIFFASINQPVLDNASASRFNTIWLSRTPVNDWPSVNKAIKEATMPEKMSVVRAYIIKSLPRFMDIYQGFEDIYSAEAGSNQRQSMMLASLSAGYNILSGKEYLIETRAVIEEDDDLILFQYLLQYVIRVTPSENRSIMELMMLMLDKHDVTYTRTLQQHGIIIDKEYKNDEGNYSTAMHIAHTHSGLKGVFKGSPFANHNIKSNILQVPGAVSSKPHKTKNFAGSRLAYVTIPQAMLEQMGLFDGKPQETLEYGPPPASADEPQPTPIDDNFIPF